VAQRQRVLIARDVDRDVIGIARHERYAIASILRVRHGKLVACENVPLDLGPDTSHDEIVETFLKQFYSMSSELPPEIVVDRDPPDREAIEKWLSSRAGRRVRCRAFSRGRKKLLVSFAEENAEQALRRSFRLRHPPKAVVELGEALGLSGPPRLISAADVSNIQGAHAVGTVITLRDGRPDKALYRKYRIKTVKGSDDCAMIREIVARHLKRITTEDREPPNLLLVDGGKGQLAAAAAAVTDASLKGVSLVALAKRQEEVFVPGRARPIPLTDGSPSKRLLQRARDEAHRFSISYHRSVRESTVRHSLLDGIPGVGQARKAALLRRFGSVAAIAERSTDELAEVPGIGIETARKIKEALG
jgi:excinuclease ABC subunit C